jgi:hypothetical protein
MIQAYGTIMVTVFEQLSPGLDYESEQSLYELYASSFLVDLLVLSKLMRNGDSVIRYTAAHAFDPSRVTQQLTTTGHPR